jgi:hypothetical protein
MAQDRDKRTIADLRLSDELARLSRRHARIDRIDEAVRRTARRPSA